MITHSPPKQPESIKASQPPANRSIQYKLKQIKKKVLFIYRFSPFLMLVLTLSLLFIYLLFSRHNRWLIVLIFPFIIVNTLYLDIALWKYFRGKKKLFIWLIELPLSLGIIYLCKKLFKVQGDWSILPESRYKKIVIASSHRKFTNEFTVL